MNYNFLIFTVGMAMTLAFQAKTHKLDSFATVQTIQSEIFVDHDEVLEKFAGHLWLENHLVRDRVDLNHIYQSHLTREQKQKMERKIARSLPRKKNMWIEKRNCSGSPLFEKPSIARITSRYGYRTHPVSGRRHIHAGLDFRGGIGTPIVSSTAGRIKHVGRKGAYGKTIVVDHGDGFTTLYGHLSHYGVKKDEMVNSGQTIGFIGKTGRATGPHLHFELRCHNVPINPSDFLGKIGKVAKVRFRRRYKRTRIRRPAHHGPSYYTRLMNQQKLRSVLDHKKGQEIQKN